jgi:hypothetical protein
MPARYSVNKKKTAIWRGGGVNGRQFSPAAVPWIRLATVTVMAHHSLRAARNFSTTMRRTNPRPRPTRHATCCLHASRTYCTQLGWLFFPWSLSPAIITPSCVTGCLVCVSTYRIPSPTPTLLPVARTAASSLIVFLLGMLVHLHAAL